MRNAKELEFIFMSIWVLNHVSEKKNDDIENIMEYAFGRILGTSGYATKRMLLLSTIGRTKEDCEKEVFELLEKYTQFRR